MDNTICDEGTIPLETEFQRILQEQDLTSVYQPIVSLFDASIYGFEALTRGPVNSVFHSPLNLFCYAEEKGDLYHLEMIAREKAIQNFASNKNQMLFLNISSHVICDPQFVPGKTLAMLQRYGFSPNNIVFEITERSSFSDFSAAKKVLEHYRKQGYKIAIDDAGAGYSSLQAIAELSPEYIKIDRSLIQDIHKDKMKECIVETFVAFAQKMNIFLVAEGIEQPDELMKLTRMGVHYGQGFFLGKPMGVSQTINEKAVELIRQQKLRGTPGAVSWVIGDLAYPIEKFDKSALISEVASYFNQNETATGTVIVDNDVPVGLVMRERLFQQLAGQYGYSLYWKRPIVQLMDKEPLIVDEMLSVEQVSQMATAREKNKLYDLVVIKKEGKLTGVTSVQSILECITSVRVESARVANPLTGLPGNIQIHREINKRALSAKYFSVVYVDLDFFKWFNDRFGFQRGDHLIQFTADILQQSVAACGTPHDFVGHIGGDDFIAVTETDNPRQLCQEIIRRFDQGVSLLLEGETVEYILDREGNKVDSKGITISLSLIICECDCPVSFENISHTAVNLKKQAKAQRGSVYVCESLTNSTC